MLKFSMRRGESPEWDSSILINRPTLQVINFPAAALRDPEICRKKPGRAIRCVRNGFCEGVKRTDGRIDPLNEGSSYRCEEASKNQNSRSSLTSLKWCLPKNQKVIKNEIREESEWNRRGGACPHGKPAAASGLKWGRGGGGALCNGNWIYF